MKVLKELDDDVVIGRVVLEGLGNDVTNADLDHTITLIIADAETEATPVVIAVAEVVAAALAVAETLKVADAELDPDILVETDEES